MDKDKERKEEGELRKEGAEQKENQPEEGSRSRRSQNHPRPSVLSSPLGGARNCSSLEGEGEDAPKEVIEVGGEMEMEGEKDGLLLLPKQHDPPQEESHAVSVSEVNGQGTKNVKRMEVEASSPSSSYMKTAHVGDVGAEKGSSEDLEEGEAEAEAHPCLLNEDVLDMIFKNIVNQPEAATARDVQNCRLVCKPWRNSVTRLYRQSEHSTAIFDIYDDDGEYIEYLSEFVDTMESSEMVPVQKYTFNSSVFKGPNLKLFGDFLRICGPGAVSFDIAIDFGDAEKILLVVENIPNFSMPSLKTLEFLTIDPEDRPMGPHLLESAGQSVKLLEHFLNAAQSLREFVVTPEFDVSTPFTQEDIITEQMGEVIARSIPRILKKLNMYMDMSESTANTLAEVGLKLDWFSVYSNSRMGSGALYKFFQSQASTLQHVHLWGGDGVRDVDHEEKLVKFPRMDELFYLKLSQVSVGIASGFAKTFPKLHELELVEMGKEDMLALLSRVKRPPPSLKILHLPRYSSTSFAPLIKNVSQSFPFLVELHIGLSHEAKETMEEVFNYFQNLESLSISFTRGEGRSVHVDELFTGISAFNCNRIRGEFPDLRMADLSDFERTPSLLNLTKLKKLVLRTFNSTPITLTDITAQFVFSEMTTLRKIHLTNTLTEFSPRYAELLKDKLVVGERNQN